MNNRLNYSLDLTARSWAEFQKIITCVYNRYGYNVQGVSISSKDTEFQYDLYLSHGSNRINKPQIEIVRNYIIGVADCFRMS